MRHSRGRRLIGSGAARDPDGSKQQSSSARACTRLSVVAMVLPGRELLSGTVEVDETYVGARHTSVGGRSPGHKAIVAIAVEGDQAPSGYGCDGSLTSSGTR